ncbi:MAG: hypothetical protein LQ342_005639 [Letrouitia transgressa]|nr:MAG: hypothetical protein LQ342_005639 [Letrouitia transgressa]
MAPKTKGQKMDLGTFLTDSSLGSWADEMEDMPMPLREQLPLPTKPPYTVHLGNMSFDATEGDIEDFFFGCQVTNVRIVEDKIERKPKGFGYAEFATLEGLKKALELNGTQFQGRNMRISVAEPQKERPDVREFNDWTRKGPLPDLPGRRASDRGGYSAPRSFDNVSEAGSERSNRRQFDQGDGKVRDFNNWDRKGPLAPASTPGPAFPRADAPRPMSRDGPGGMRRNSPSWGEGRSDAGSRPPRREFVERPVIERALTAAEKDTQWRNNMKPDAPVTLPAKSPSVSNQGSSTPSSPLAAPATLAAAPAPTVRPKLNLQKRTVTEVPTEAQINSAAADSKASPFGAARPIDTAAREREVEEKRQIALREKKEAEEKAREEKKIADEKAREEKRLTAEAQKASKPEKGASTADKPNGIENEKESIATSPSVGKSYEILRRQTNDETNTADTDVDGDAQGIITEDKSVKPQTIVQDISTKHTDDQTNGSTPVEPSAEALEEEGWSTVSKPQKPRKNQRNGNIAARAIAS